MKRSVAALGVLLAVSACSSGVAASKPSTASSAPRVAVSASAACHDFAVWYLGTDSLKHPGSNLAVLTRAVNESPSGTLYTDMSTLEQTVDADLTGQFGSAGIGSVTVAAYQAENDCQSVNPQS